MPKNNMNIVSINANELPIGINALIINEHNQIVLGLRAGHRGGAGTYGLVGGKTQNGESIEETARREIKEETGLDVNLEDLEVINMFTTQSTADVMFYQIGVLVKKYSGQPKNLEPKKCDELKFFNLDNLPTNLFLGTKGNIDLYLKNKFYDKTVNYDYRNDLNK